MTQKTLYDKYGGFPAVSTIVHNFYDKILASQSLEKFFAGVDMDRLIDHQVKFLCMVLGGPNNYSGRQLGAAHANLKIDKGAFGEVAQHLKASLEEAGVEPQDVGTILGVVASTASQIITV